MSGASRARRATALAAAALLGACRAAAPTPVPSTAPAVTPAVTPAAAPVPRERAPEARRVSEAHPADARFLVDMIAHHAQALVMTELVPARTRRADLRALAERIAVSQRDEIALMRAWLAGRGEGAPPDGAHAGHAGAHGGAGAGDHAGMPGMLTPADLRDLAAQRGAAFERRFLEAMIRHHEGALAMVATYLATTGAAQEPAVFRLASDVDADQRAEIRRMRALLAGGRRAPVPQAPRS